MPTPAETERTRLDYDIERLNLALITAVGLDPAEVAGIRLDVIPGTAPQLVAFHHPANLGDLANPDTPTNRLAQALDSVTYAVLPGQDTAMPVLRDPGPARHLVPLGWPLNTPEAVLVRVLPMLVEAVNGARYSDDQRYEMTTAAEAALTAIRQRLDGESRG